MPMLLRIGQGNLVLLNLEKVMDGGISNNIIVVIIFSFVDLGGLLVVDVVNKVI